MDTTIVFRRKIPILWAATKTKNGAQRLDLIECLMIILLKKPRILKKPKCAEAIDREMVTTIVFRMKISIH
jgi:hypothetical protein